MIPVFLEKLFRRGVRSDSPPGPAAAPRRRAVRSQASLSDAAEIEIGGRVYVPVRETTAEHDFQAMALLRAAGLDELTVEPGETADAFVLRILSEIISRKQLFELISYLIVPRDATGASWTPETGAETASRLSQVTDEADKATIRGIVVELVLHFLAEGVVSLTTSSSSGATSPPPSTTLSFATASGAG